MLSSQTVFNKAAIHLLRQGKKALDKKGHPKYRKGFEGCAIAPLLVEGYKKSLEGKSVGADAVLPVLKKNGVNVDRDLPLLSQLQRMHDLYEASTWPERLSTIAKTFNLKMVKQKLVVRK